MSTIGATAPSQHTINYDALLSTTLMAYRPTMIDNIFKSSAFLAALRKYGGIEYQNGGERVQIPLMYEENDTFKSYSGSNSAPLES
uniref:Putative capsid protein n=1 Tax=viral metagenome TaxID=1070528 RepID=A0A6M3K6S5_9ZZZZ